MFQDEQETKNEREQGVDGEERCECQLFSVVAYLKVENSIEQENDQRRSKRAGRPPWAPLLGAQKQEEKTK